ncbi:MAG: Immunity protein 10 [Bacteroidota bacterium]|jgi:hypothetical protein
MRTKELVASVYGQAISAGNVLTVGFANDESYSEFLMVQYSDEFDEQDEAFGWTKYYLDTSFCEGDYSCLEKVSLSDFDVVFHLNARGKQHFDVDRLIVRMVLTESEKESAITSLVSIFKDEPDVLMEFL